MIDRLAELSEELVGGVGLVLAVAVVAVAAVAIALAIHAIVFRVLRRIAHGSEGKTDDMLVGALARPTRYALVALALVLAAREMPALEVVRVRLAGLVMPALLGWIALTLVRALVAAMEIKAETSQSQGHDMSGRRTRLAIFSRIASFVIVFITVGLMLLSIPGVRDIGVTLVASAGLATLAVGAAAQPALKSLIAGFQMAITEPIRIGDMVVIEGESGRVENIHLTYVVIRTDDERRLIVPTSKFLDTSFQNWNRVSGSLTGSVVLPVEPGHPIAPIRAAFTKMLAERPEWDKRMGDLQVSDVKPGSIELKLILSARSAVSLARLQFAMREGMIEWLREEMPDALKV